MGCVESNEAPENENVQKEYSWDKREKIDPVKYTIANTENEEVGRLPGSINGQQFIIQNCKSSQIYLFDNINVVTIDDCSGCVIFLGPATGSIFLRDCEDCTIMAACGQFRARDCNKIDILLHCQTQPIIEASRKMRFGCFQAFYPELEGQFRAAGISVFNNNWSNIYDFTPVEGEKNWSLIPKTIGIDQVFQSPKKNEFNKVGFSTEEQISAVPYTHGTPNYTGEETSLIVIFYEENQYYRAREIITCIKRELLFCSLQYSKEVKLESSDASRIFPTGINISTFMKGPIIALLFVGENIGATCKKIVSDINNASQTPVAYTACDDNTGYKEIEALFTFSSITMTL